jgi:ubiquinone/menaquinone biosynthesis C-methylase UbiE
VSQSKNWTDYWQKEGAAGEVYVDKKGNKSPFLSDFWHHYFVSLSKENTHKKLIDIASGAGSIFAELAKAHPFELFAADVSGHALEQLNSRIANVTTTVCSAACIPFEDRTFDIIVSQFGIEYGGIAAFEEATRLLKKGGELVFLCHHEDGSIDSRNKIELHGAYLVKEIEFIHKAFSVTQGAFSGDAQAFNQECDAFVEVEPRLAAFCQAHPNGVHAYLYSGFKTLFSQRNAYTEEDIVKWLAQMAPEVDKAILRLEEMRKATLSISDMQNIRQGMLASGLTRVEFSPLSVPVNSLPLAWHISARRP